MEEEAKLLLPIKEAKSTKIGRKLRTKLLSMAGRDREMRAAWGKGERTWNPEVDCQNAQKLKEIIEKFGWPAKSLVGVEGANAAWLIAQHADHDVKFQEECLKLLEEAARKGETSLENLAYLTDRVRVNRGQRQLYGTQFIGTDEDLFKPQPIEDPELLDERRKAVGMIPFSDYLDQMKKSHEGLSKKTQVEQPV